MTGRPLYRQSRRQPVWSDVRSSASAPANLPRATPITRTLTPDSIRHVASRGFPLKEDLGTIVLRNKRITLAYQDLGRQFGHLLNGRGMHVKANNWCTFAAWSSRTIGATIDPSEIGLLVGRVPFRQRLIKLTQFLRGRNHGAIFRSLAAGNRFIFLEIGLAATLFIERFGGLDDDEGELIWAEYESDLEGIVEELRHLDPSWVGSRPGDPDMLRQGMRLYYEALFLHDRTSRYSRPDRDIQDPEHQADLKSELVLAANLQLGAYEQFRADAYVLTSFAWHGKHAFRRLLVRGVGRSYWPHKYVSTWAWTRVVTKFSLAMILPYEVIHLGRRLQPPIESVDDRGVATRGTSLFPKHVDRIDEPRVQALVSKFDLNDDELKKRGAKNWMHYRERMHLITNLFRAYHEYEPLTEVPVFTNRVASDLRAGYLPGTRPPAEVDEME
jgi:hypothetical protein